MNKIVLWKMFFVALGALVIGVTIGLLLIGFQLSQKILNQISDDSFMQLTDRLLLLEHLQRGDTNAAKEHAESQMIHNIIVLAEVIESTKDPRATRAYSNVLSRAIRYRARHGLRHADPEIEALLAEVAGRFPAQAAAGTSLPPTGNPASVEASSPPE